MRWLVGCLSLVLGAVVLAAEPVVAPADEARLVHWSEVKIGKRVAPTYPREARDRDLEGDCKLRLVIDERGKTMSTEVISCDPAFVKACEEAAMSTTFYPMRLEGEPVKATFVMIYKFRLSPSAMPPSGPQPPEGDFIEAKFSDLDCPQRAQVAYPESARLANVESTCRVMLYFSPQGEVIHTEALDCGEPFLSAVSAPKQPFRCTPPSNMRASASVKAEYTFNFDLQ